MRDGPLLMTWLRTHAQRRPDAEAIVIPGRSHRPRRTITFSDLEIKIDRLASDLRNRLTPGSTVMVSLPNDESFVVAFLAIHQADAIAVPAPVPTAVRGEAFQERLRGIAHDCSPSLVLTSDKWAARLRSVLGDALPIQSWDAPLEDVTSAKSGFERGVESDRTVFVQYTSGSTSRPKGIVVTARMIESNLTQVSGLYGEQAEDTAVTWVPFFHDMGLVTGILRPLYFGYRSVLMRPEEFVSDPLSWLDILSDERGTLSSAPNFGYDLCVRKADTDRLRSIDLSSWRIARNAGEVVLASSAEKFAAVFGPAGFDRRAFCPSYGMAEATLTVTTCTPEVASSRVRPQPKGLGRESADRTVELLSSGPPLPGTEVRIEGADGDGVIGPISIRGPQVFSHYWNEDHQGPVWLDGDWLRTGDLGMMQDGHLFVLGREDDVLIVLGQKYFIGTDVLPACAAVNGIRPGRVGVFSIRVDGADEVHLVAELVKGAEFPPEHRSLRRQIQRAVTAKSGLFVSAVHLAMAGTLPVTTSGKVRHSNVRERYLNGSLDVQ